MKYFLHEITDSYFGANLPAKPTGHINCVQGRDFDTSGVFYGNELQYVDESALRYTRFLEKGDVLFSSKGKLYATVWQEQVKNVVATSTFLIIKIKTPTILPEYLAMYLNSYKARRYYDLHVKTTTVFHIGKKQMDMMEIDVPDLHRQRILVNAYTLMQEEKKILNEIIIRKNNIIKTLIR